MYAAVRSRVQASDVAASGDVLSAEVDDDDDDDDNDVTADSVCSVTSHPCTTTNSRTPLKIAGYIQLYVVNFSA